VTDTRDAGKGDTPRPFSVDVKTYAKNWEATFNSKKDNNDTPTAESILTVPKS
jgi:uncharacterized protein (DUF111 family)